MATRTRKANPKPAARRMRVTYWRACELIGEERAAGIWARADADQEETLEITVAE